MCWLICRPMRCSLAASPMRPAMRSSSSESLSPSEPGLARSPGREIPPSAPITPAPGVPRMMSPDEGPLDPLALPREFARVSLMFRTLFGGPLAPLGPLTVTEVSISIGADSVLAGMDCAGEGGRCTVGGALGLLAAAVCWRADSGAVSSLMPLGVWTPEGFASGICGG